MVVSGRIDTLLLNVCFDFSKVRVKWKHYIESSYHGCSKGNVVNERRGQSRDPHHQDNGNCQALVFWHRLREEITRVTDKSSFHCHSEGPAPPPPPPPISDLHQTHQLCRFFDTEPLVRELGLSGWSLNVWHDHRWWCYLVTLLYTQSKANSPHVTGMMFSKPSW